MNIPAIETYYAGRLFRSRLEAQWAAVFDLLGWKWIYEPFDADGYIPDFAITGAHPLLVEVKPALTLPELQVHVPRVTAAVEAWRRDVLFLGAGPSLPGDEQWDAVTAGLLAEFIGAPDDAYAVAQGLWATCLKCNSPAIFHEEQSYACRPCGHYDGDHYLGSAPDVHGFWNLAGNKVRWEGRR